jgi:hypothetical protein
MRDADRSAIAQRIAHRHQLVFAFSGGGNSVREVAAPSQPVQQTLTRQQWQQVVQQALADGQSAGATADQLAPLRQVHVSIEALLASDLGEEAGNQVWISPNAAGLLRAES